MTSRKLQWIGIAAWFGIVAAGIIACGSHAGEPDGSTSAAAVQTGSATIVHEAH
jgi:hypothetical protein